MAEDTDYYREIERHWSWRRQKQIIVSPIEFEEIEKWRREEVPLAVAMRAIDLFVTRKEKAKRPRAYLLTHVRGDVAKVLREYQALRQGDDRDEDDLLASKMSALIKKVEKLGKAYPEDAAFIAERAARLAAIDLARVVGFEEIEAQLSDCERELLDRFLDKLGADDRAALREEVEEVVSEEEDRQFFQKLIRDAVRVHFGLPRITLLA